MKWASIMSKFNDLVSCQTIGTMQCLIYQILESHQHAPQEMNRLMERITQDADQTIREIKRNLSQQAGVLPHAQAPVTSNSYCTVLQMVQRALTDALQTAPVVTQPSPQPKRKRTRRAKKRDRDHWMPDTINSMFFRASRAVLLQVPSHLPFFSPLSCLHLPWSLYHFKLFPLH